MNYPIVAAILIGFGIFTIFDQSSSLSGIFDQSSSLSGASTVTRLLRSIDGELTEIMSNPAKQVNKEISSRTYVVTTTYYPDVNDIRFHLALEMCALAKLYEMHLIIVDDSPDHESVRERFQQAGSNYVHTYQQDKSNYSGKGGALRQAIQQATTLIQENHTGKGNGLKDAVICFTEPEKVDLMNHMSAIAKPILDGATDVVIPTRDDQDFKESYPIEQYHSESFGNMHFNLLAKQFEGFQREGATKLDWLFGPFAFKARLATGWLKYEGTSWDAQIIPYVRGVREENWKIMSVTVNFQHPRVMKEQEEGYPAWTKKRLLQLNLLFDLLGDKELSPR